MCNKLNLKIKSVNKCGLKHGFVPCGVCYNCRSVIKNSWIFRLRCELSELAKKGWKIGFFTLTYDDKHLPHIPIELISSEFKRIPCFKKSDVREFFTKLKKWLNRKYGCYRGNNGFGEFQDLAPRYMVCSEYGEHTQRPHYHGIICVPGHVDMRELHNKIKQLWYSDDYDQMYDSEGRRIAPKKGFVFPFCFEGGFDSEGYEHKPFVCDSVKAAACYAAKYVCKDLAYLDFIRDVKFYKKRCILPHSIVLKKVENYEVVSDVFGDLSGLEVIGEGKLVEESVLDSEMLKRLQESCKRPSLVIRLSDYMPFHYQSKSLGLCFLNGLTDSQKLTYLKNGFAFDGEDSLQGLPIYFRNKILFSPKYVIDENGKRLVRREAKQFFYDNLFEIFQTKKKNLVDKINDWKSLDFWCSVGVDSDELRMVEKMVSFRSVSSDVLASDYLAYFGVPYSFCYDINRSLVWFNRYDDEDNPRIVIEPSMRCISADYYDWLHYCFNFYHKLSNKYEIKLLDKKTADAREISRIDDFWRSH